MGEIDFQAIAEAALRNADRLLPTWFPNGFFEGKRNFRMGGIHGGEGESLMVTIAGKKAGIWFDFAGGTDKGSDLISLYAAHRGIDQGAAAKEIAEQLRMGPPPMPENVKRRPASSADDDDDPPTPIVPVPADAPAPKFRAPEEWGRENGRWRYADETGATLMWTVRHDKATGKDLRPHTYCQHKKGPRWRWKALPKPWPLYGLDRLAAKPEATVVLCEGEKKADAGARLLPAQVVMGWPGGIEQAIRKHLNLAPLAGRKVVLWPDADRHTYEGEHPAAGQEMPREEQPGWRAMLALADQLREIAAGVRIVVPPADREDGWDLADAEEEGWTQDSTLAWMRGHLVDPHAPPEPLDEPPPEETEIHDEPEHTETPEPPAIEDNEPTALPEHPHFKPLGHHDSQFYYLSKLTRQVVRIGGGGHTKLALLQLAPLQYWEREFAGEKGPRWDAAASTCMNACGAVGVWDAARIRGRGCWWDRGRMVVHLGDRLLVDGSELATTAIRSGYVYEAAPKMRGPGLAPLSAKEARRIVETAKRFSWEMPASAALLCGWIALAPICGALNWRPHVWLTGGSGSGKTTVLEGFLGPLCAGTEIRVQGASTEAGIRQTLRADARPVIFDESESNDERERSRIQAIMALIRQSSSESGAQTLKGTAGGNAMAFHIRSMFCLASINVTIRQQADHTRIAVLGLRSGNAGNQEERAANWKALEAELEALAADRELPGRLLARTVSLIPVIRANIKTFVRVAARHFKSQRLGDQYGTLLAGCYALWSDGEATEQQALELIGRFDWTTYTEEAEEDESLSCLSSILQAPVRVDLDKGAVTATLGELVACACDMHGPVGANEACAVLGRYGLRVRETMLVVANKSDALAKLLREKPWGHGWHNYLRRIKGAAVEKPMQFVSGHVSRGTAVPLEVALPNYA